MSWSFKLCFCFFYHRILKCCVSLTGEKCLQAAVVHEFCDDTEGLIGCTDGVKLQQTLVSQVHHDFNLCCDIWADG